MIRRILARKKFRTLKYFLEVPPELRAEQAMALPSHAVLQI
jgi:hypothetical protein